MALRDPAMIMVISKNSAIIGPAAPSPVFLTGLFDETGTRCVRQEPITRKKHPMSYFDRNAAVPGTQGDRSGAAQAGLRAYMLNIYNYMAMGVALTGLLAMLTFQLTGPALLASPLMWVFMLAPLGLVFFISARINTLSAQTARLLFFVYAALVGVSLSTIFHVYTKTSITQVFFISAASFGALSLWGYTTKRDLSGFGTFLFMGLVGVVIASLVNLFLRSSALDWTISVIGVGVFCPRAADAWRQAPARARA